MKYEVPIYEVRLVRAERAGPLTKIFGSKDAGKVLQKYLAGADREHFVVMMLDRKRNIIGIHTVSVGSLSQTVVHPREVFKTPILCNSDSIIIGHNHLGGDCEPSKEDLLSTERLVNAGQCLDIEVLDHIIVSNDGVLSFREHGLMKSPDEARL